MMATAQNNVSIWNGSSEIWTQGQGTQSNPYLIENAQQLAYIAEMVNGGVTHYNNTYFKLTTNVYIDSITVWQPIGLNGTYYFGGHFDGDNHTVTLYLTTNSMQYVGIFGYAKNGSFQNITSVGRVTRTSASSIVYAGGICGSSNSSPFTNCHNTGDISSTSTSSFSYSGGICGYSTAAVSNCHNTGDISDISSTSTSSFSYSGGICGYSAAAVSNCHNAGDISSSSNYSSYSGGICGNSTAAVSNCHNAGDISSSSNYSYSSNSYSSNSGGICGCSSAAVSHCYNIANVTSSSTSTSTALISRSGGICGYSSSTITNCYNTGNISSVKLDYAYAGGICGYGYYSSNNTPYYVTIKNCYNVGSLLSGTRKGGICGYYGTITNCHYLNTCGHNSGNGTAKTEAQMKSSSFPVILNADSVVFVIDITPNINQGYPVFGSVSTQDADDVGATTARLHGRYQMLYDVDAHGFEYKKNSEGNYTSFNTTGDSPVSYNLSGLQGGTAYTYRFFVQKDGVIYRGADKTFTTATCNLSVQVTATPAKLCDGDTVTYTAVPTGGSGYQYSWSNGSHSNAIGITTDATYTVTVTDNLGCQVTASKQLTLYPAAVASISGSAVLCNNSSTTLTANGGTTYLWSTGSSQRTITVSQPGTYVTTVTTVYGCSASDSVVVTPFANPSILGEATFCSGGYTTLTATGGDSYQWSMGATSATINVNTAGNYSVTASTENGCSGSTSVNVVENQPAIVTITGNSVICNETGTTLTATSGASYLWSSGETTQSINVNNPGSYSVTVMNANGCSGSSSQTVTMMEPAVITGNTNICEGESAILSVSGAGTYTWSNGAHTSSITVGTPGTYTVTASLPNGCSSTASAEVTVATAPTPTILGNTTLCQGQSTTLTVNGGTSYAWSNGSTNNNISVNQSGVYTVTTTNTEGCSNTASVTVTVNPLPNVSISGSSSFCQGSIVVLTAIGASSYSWSNGNNSSTITVSNPGTYTLIGTDANNCTNTASKTVTANPTYNVPITHSICQGETYHFNGQNLTTAGTYTQYLSTVNGCDSIVTLTLTVKSLPTPVILGNTTLCQGQSTSLSANGGVSYHWNNGSTNNNINVSQSGVYTVTATNAEGCSATANVSVTVNPLPSVNISGNNSFCQGDNVTLTATGASAYVWNNASTNASINVSSAGTYTVTGTDANGCTNTAMHTVSVNPTYNIPLTLSICEGENYNFHGQYITTAGTFTHTLQTVNGCDSVLTLVVTLKALPPTAITGNTTICEGETATLTANGGVTYSWSNGGTGNSISVSQSGIYTVTTTNAEGCSATANVTVVVNPLPNVNISGNSSFCQGDNVTLSATGANTYVWNNTSTNETITVSNAGSYAVTGTDANGCTNIAAKTISVNPTYNVALAHSMCEGESYNFYGQNITAAGTYTHTLQTVNGCDSVLTLVVTLKALPTAAISGNTTICEGETVTLTANGGVSYLWNNGSTNNNISVNQSEVYTVTVTNAEGCSNTSSVTVTVNPLPTITIAGNMTLCAGNSTSLTATGADSFSWSTGDNTATVSISAFGIYTVTGTSTAGCSNTAEVTVLVSQLPVISISGETDICAGESTTLTANGGEIYLWSDGTTANTLTVNMAGTYQVIGYNAAGCYSIADATVSVWQPAASEFTVVCPDSCYIWNGESYCQSGDYIQTLQTVRGCDSIVTLHLTITVGVEEYNAFDFKVYPNPTNGVVNVQWTVNNEQWTDGELQVLDMYGRLLNVIGVNNDSSIRTAQIDLSHYANGVYFIKMVADDKTIAVQKVVKQ
ncbi:MAG: T9SS type A sorting domain-containing protein [Bacteroidales bacterium]|nr:T9SS type A sorting domain-containing protein [Bacteroidales bacterium]